MLTFKQYLLEQNNSIENTSTAEEVAEIIKRDCAPFLKEICDKLPLYRGSKKLLLWTTKMSVRKDRKPMDASLELHNTLNTALQELSGINYRTEAVFATGSRRSAYDYGNSYLFFPIGKFNYAWSPLITDAYTFFGQGSDSEAVESGELVYYPENRSKYLDDVFDYVMSGKAMYKFDTGLRDAATSKNEIMFACDEYYLVPDHPEAIPSDDILKLLI